MVAAAVALPRGRRRSDPALWGAVLAAVVLAGVALAPRPAAVLVPPSLPMVVADLRGHALIVLDTGDPARARRIPLPGGPHELAPLPDGRIAVSLEQYGALAIVDIDRGAVETLPVGGVPHGLAVVRDTLYVTDRAADAVRRFRLGTWAEEAPLPVGAWPHVIVPLEDGTLAIANARDDTLTIGTRRLPVSHVPESVAVAPDGRIATAGSIGGALHVFDALGAPLARHEVGGRPVRLLYDARGRVLAAALSAEGTVALLEGGRMRRVAVGGVPDGLAFSADGRWLYVSDMAHGGVAVVHVGDGRLVQRLPAGQTAGALLLRPRG